MKPRITYANVMATLAMFVALGGVAWAATQLPKNSVGAKQLKRNAVRTPKIKDEAVTGAKIRKGTITGSLLNLTSIGTVPSAQTAASATDAKTLAGAEPSAYLGRVAQTTAKGANLGPLGPGITDGTPGGALSIIVPAGVGFVAVDGAATFAEATTDTEIWVQEDEPCIEKGFGSNNRMYGSIEAGKTPRDELSQHLVFPVTPGRHIYRLCLRAPGADVFSRTLSAMTVARGAFG